MGRGYSVSRTATQRPTNKDKRPRSVSMAKVRKQLTNAAAGVKKQQEMAETPNAAMAAAGDSDEDDYASEDENETVRRADVMTKYKICGTITDEAVKTVGAACIAGASTFDLCEQGDGFVADKVKKMFQKSKSDDGKKMLKGLCFPTTVAVNNILCNASPANKEEAATLKNGDVVKVSCAVHLDGYPTTSAVTLVVGAADGAITSLPSETAHVLAATHYAIHGMVRLMKPGTENQDITDYIAHVGKCFGVEPVEGVLSNRTKRWILDGQNCIITRRVLTEDPQQNVADCVIGENEVWTLDVAFTTSKNYRMRQAPLDTNIYRRNEITLEPKLKSTQELLKEVRDNYMCFPWSPLRVSNVLRARMGVSELRKLDMLDTFPILGSQKGFVTARHSCTVAVTEKRTHILAGAPSHEVPAMVVSSATNAPSSDVLELMTEPLSAAEMKKTTKKGSKSTAANPAADAPDEDDDANNAAAELPTRSRKAHRSGV
eukprot:CAMPEP_0174850996 /NCGR_PEP_ID=MMETSP1114-20130205/21250_1 /TAXON_ID=312471 /ORGANISM="Neobodo designis, Strain CCAP 1951/1" /LENGTH=487 /DNA_ID=CAMNT_0016085493 /DNA_START=33 /DNA_END=1496 /DNA_ORIENTATION=-